MIVFCGPASEICELVQLVNQLVNRGNAIERRSTPSGGKIAPRHQGPRSALQAIDRTAVHGSPTQRAPYPFRRVFQRSLQPEAEHFSIQLLGSGLIHRLELGINLSLQRPFTQKVRTEGMDRTGARFFQVSDSLLYVVSAMRVTACLGARFF